MMEQWTLDMLLTYGIFFLNSKYRYQKIEKNNCQVVEDVKLCEMNINYIGELRYYY